MSASSKKGSCQFQAVQQHLQQTVIKIPSCLPFSIVKSFGQGIKPPLPSGKTAGDMSISAVFSSLGGIGILKPLYVSHE